MLNCPWTFPSKKCCCTLVGPLKCLWPALFEWLCSPRCSGTRETLLCCVLRILFLRPVRPDYIIVFYYYSFVLKGGCLWICCRYYWKGISTAGESWTRCLFCLFLKSRSAFPCSTSQSFSFKDSFCRIFYGCLCSCRTGSNYYYSRNGFAYCCCYCCYSLFASVSLLH